MLSHLVLKTPVFLKYAASKHSTEKNKTATFVLFCNPLSCCFPLTFSKPLPHLSIPCLLPFLPSSHLMDFDLSIHFLPPYTTLPPFSVLQSDRSSFTIGVVGSTPVWTVILAHWTAAILLCTERLQLLHVLKREQMWKLKTDKQNATASQIPSSYAQPKALIDKTNIQESFKCVFIQSAIHFNGCRVAA